VVGVVVGVVVVVMGVVGVVDNRFFIGRKPRTTDSSVDVKEISLKSGLCW